MFNPDDQREEVEQRSWYPLVGEFVVLFSILEFELSSWINLLANTESEALRRFAADQTFDRRLTLLLQLFSENDANKAWENAWNKARKLSITRNSICHNPPINNFDLTLDEVTGKVTLGEKAVEILRLSRPIGSPGSGLDLNQVQSDIAELRALLSQLDSLHTEIILRSDR